MAHRLRHAKPEMAYQSASAQIYAYPLILLLLLPVTLLGQDYHSSSKKAIKTFEKAKISYQENDFNSSLKFLDDAISFDATFLEAWLLKAEILSQQNDNQAITSYERILEIDSSAFPRVALSLSRIYVDNQRFDEADDLLEWYLTQKGEKIHFIESARKLLITARFRKEAIANPVKFSPRNLGSLVNTAADEYINQIQFDGSELLFTRRIQYEDNQGIKSEVIYASTMMDGVWLPPIQLVFNWRYSDNMGAVFITADGKEMYFSGCNWLNGRGSCDIYVSFFRDGRWAEPRNLGGNVNTSNWESQPCVSVDGKELYFARRSRDKNTSDLYVANRQQDGTWSDARPLDSLINTDGNEMAPFIHPDGKTLYFSSDGHVGMGGYDLFMSRRGDDGKWGRPVNLGYPLNTGDDEINFTVSADAKKAYISSQRADGFGAYDIYDFDLDEVLRPDPVLVELPSTEEVYEDAFAKGESVALKDIHFQFDSAELDTASMRGIEILAEFLMLHPEINIELSGHTDDMGDKSYNERLSLRRAEAVREELRKRGINPQRLTAVGYGAERPLVPNDNDEHRALNRRTEMKKKT